MDRTIELQIRTEMRIMTDVKAKSICSLVKLFSDCPDEALDSSLDSRSEICDYRFSLYSICYEESRFIRIDFTLLLRNQTIDRMLDQLFDSDALDSRQLIQHDEYTIDVSSETIPLVMESAEDT
ncbi:hypothetical protein Syun_015663 [Stephania yunnanensis]|uniref:Uncharacterized protein n=1 Tax=Stephania yunnanensis TaxID=152371 RepID=A0AAP0JLL2_9MAGN